MGEDTARLLVVDDSEVNRKVLTRSLEAQGYAVEVAENGRIALDRLRAAPFDLVVLDIEMPEMDGFEVLEAMKADESLADVRVVVTSSLEALDGVVRCIELGAEDYLHKPVNHVLLRARVGSALAKKRMTDELREWNLRLSERVDEKVREVERLNTLRRFVTPQLADVIAAGGNDILRSHRREITVLFCDLRGFTSFSETSEPEQIMGVLKEFHDAVGPKIFEYEGTIAQFTGDGMLVIFNDPVPCADPAWQAVQLAVEMRDRTGELSQQWRRRGHLLELGIGIAVGYATCGEIGFEGRTEYTAIGTVVNLAARICGIAPGGQVLVAQGVHTAVEDRVVARDLGEIEFKGLTRPVPTYEIVALRS